MPQGLDLANRIVDATLALADEIGWERVHLHAVADRLGVSLTEVRKLYPDLDAVGNAWIARADLAMLALRDDAGFAALPAAERIFRAMMGWLDALAAHRPAVRAILRYKFRPAHIHHQAALVVALSRTVQWVREAAVLEASGRQREQEEVALTLLFVATVMFWLQDGSEHQERTRQFLRRRLNSGLARRMWPVASTRDRAAVTASGAAPSDLGPA